MAKSIKDEFIGNDVEILQSTNRQLIGLHGKIVDETKSSFKVLVHNKNYNELKMIFKKDAIFKINKLRVDGNKIIKRSEDRIKLKD